MTDAEMIAAVERDWHAAEDVLNRLGADLTWEEHKQATFSLDHKDVITLGAAIMGMGTLLMLLLERDKQIAELRAQLAERPQGSGSSWGYLTPKGEELLRTALSSQARKIAALREENAALRAQLAPADTLEGWLERPVGISDIGECEDFGRADFDERVYKQGATAMIEIRFKGCRVLVWDRYLETVFPDGAKVPASPNFDAASVRLAAELGYGIGTGATWQMSRAHEILHTVVAEHLGEPHSPTLWAVAHHVVTERGVKAGEEGRVLALQAHLNLGTVAPALAEIPDWPALVQKARAALEPLEQVADAA